MQEFWIGFEKRANEHVVPESSGINYFSPVGAVAGLTAAHFSGVSHKAVEGAYSLFGKGVDKRIDSILRMPSGAEQDKAKKTILKIMDKGHSLQPKISMGAALATIIAGAYAGKKLGDFIGDKING